MVDVENGSQVIRPQWELLQAALLFIDRPMMFEGF